VVVTLELVAALAAALALLALAVYGWLRVRGGLAGRHGVVSVSLTAGGSMIDVRYRAQWPARAVRPPERVDVIAAGERPAGDPASAPRVGTLRPRTRRPVPGGYMLVRNSASLRPGDTVSVSLDGGRAVTLVVG
jgi:hypothetical protein